MFIPSYIELFNSGEFKKRIEYSESILTSCTSCPRNCIIDRTQDQLGYCQSGYLPIVSSYTLHRGEEPLLSGSNGAGNIFFGNCNLRCIYCQNHEISQNWQKEKKNEISVEALAEIMIELQRRGAHNIGLVSPTHFSIQILKAIYIAIGKGLSLPIIYNSNGYDSVDIFKLFDGIIDIYLPDIKYGCNENAELYSRVNNYFDIAKAAVTEMHRQVGDKIIIENNLAKRGLIIRHLLLPNRLAESENVFKFISENLSDKIFISLMSQYYPANKSAKEILLSRPITLSEYSSAVNILEIYNLNNGWTQELESKNCYLPKFLENRDDPFTD